VIGLYFICRIPSDKVEHRKVAAGMYGQEMVETIDVATMDSENVAARDEKREL